MPDIMHLMKIEAPAEDIYRALTTAEGICEWWTRNARLDSKVGGTGEVGFFDGRVVTRVRIDELQSPARVIWTIISSSLPAWPGTIVTFHLRADAEGTVLSFAHQGFKNADENFARVTTGWAYYLASLQKYVETGRGAPHPDKNFNGCATG